MRHQKCTFEQRKEWREAYLKGEHVPMPLKACRARRALRGLREKDGYPHPILFRII